MKNILRHFSSFLLLVLTLHGTAAHALWGDDELLPQEEAFALSSDIDGDTVILHWKIARDYYLYKSRIQVQSQTEGVTTAPPMLPAGILKQDEFFGEVEIYKGDIEARIPLTIAAGAPQSFQLTVTSQGCAERGVCYPPHTETLTFTTPAAPAPTPAAALPALGKPAGGGFGFADEDEILPPEQAFQADARVIDGNTLEASWVVAEGHYLYRDRLGFALDSAEGISLGQPELPAGDMKDDPEFGRVEVYHGIFTVRLPLQRTTAAAAPATLTLKYQGCAEGRICYPPQTHEVALDIPAGTATGSGIQPSAPEPTAIPAAPVTEQDRFARMLTEKPLWLAMLIFFGLGLGLAFTPCVFPMIPILSSIIIGQGSHITTRKAFVLSLVYVLAMAITYTGAGVVAGLFGENLQAAFQNPWILGSFSTVFVLLALSMFGFYELQMPASIQSKLSEISNKQEGGSLIGAGIMGLLSALIVGPCVAPPLAATLIVIGQAGDPVLGGSALFALSMGMGLPLLAIGTGAGKLLPRAGGWMNAVKAVFGVMLLAVAIWMLERILPVTITMLLWSALLITSAVYLGALDRLDVDATGWSKLRKGLGFVILAYGVLLLVGIAAGGKDVYQPLRGAAFATAGSPSVAATQGLQFETIKSVEDLQQAVARAKAQQQPVMLDFYADWCTDCHRLEKYTFNDPGVVAALSNVLVLQADVTANDETDKALMQHFQIHGPPSIVFYDANGEEQRAYRLAGYMDAEEFTAHARAAIGR